MFIIKSSINFIPSLSFLQSHAHPAHQSPYPPGAHMCASTSELSMFNFI